MCVTFSWGHCPAETQIKVAPKNVQMTTFHHSFQTCLSLFFFLNPYGHRPKVSGRLTGHWWMDVKGVILDKQCLGPHAATSWKIYLLHRQLRETVWRSLTSSLLLTLSFTWNKHILSFLLHWNWKNNTSRQIHNSQLYSFPNTDKHTQTCFSVFVLTHY